jgi:hypothetical protein
LVGNAEHAGERMVLFRDLVDDLTLRGALLRKRKRSMSRPQIGAHQPIGAGAREECAAVG